MGFIKYNLVRQTVLNSIHTTDNTGHVLFTLILIIFVLSVMIVVALPPFIVRSVVMQGRRSPIVRGRQHVAINFSRTALRNTCAIPIYIEDCVSKEFS